VIHSSASLLKPASTDSTRSMRSSWSISQPGAFELKRTTDSRVSSLTTGALTQSGTMKWR
jgi:hypothetical protein